MKNIASGLTILLLMFIHTGLQAQMVGIGTSMPTEMLDVNGRLRIRHTNNQTAGIYFDNTNLQNRSFAGNVNADYMGFWGTGSNWNFVMNTTNGNVGIGTTSPTAKLDVNGSLRIRQNARAGAVMTSVNAQGHVGWVGPVYFMAMGTPTGANLILNNPVTIPLTYTRAIFAPPDVNLGNAWNANDHVFIAPLNGIYHFAAHLELNNSNHSLNIQVVRWRKGVNTVLYEGEYFRSYDGAYVTGNRPFEIALDTKLEINDAVWLEVNGYNNTVLSGNKVKYYFSGQLVILQ